MPPCPLGAACRAAAVPVLDLSRFFFDALADSEWADADLVTVLLEPIPVDVVRADAELEANANGEANRAVLGSLTEGPFTLCRVHSGWSPVEEARTRRRLPRRWTLVSSTDRVAKSMLRSS